MTSAIGVWDNKSRDWTFDCPNCGRTNAFDLKPEEIPDEVQGPRDKLVASVVCFRCSETTVVYLSLASLDRSSR